jgi:hypothetical protein
MCLGNLARVVGLLVALGVCAASEEGTGAAALPEWIRALQRPRPIPASQKAPTLPDLLIAPDGSRITNADEWSGQRELILNKWLRFLGKLPRRRCPLAPKETETATVDGTITRKLIQLQVEPDIWMKCYLFIPPGKGPFPACVCLHPTTDETIREPAGLGTREGRAFALDLARRGYVTMAPENFEWYYPHPTTAQGWDRFHAVAAAFRAKHPDVKGMAKMVYDISRSLDYLENLPMVRKEAIGAIGHSLGAKEVTYLMAFDERVVCGVSSEGGVAFEFTNYQDPWYLGPEIRKEGFDLYALEVVALIAPRAWLLIGGNNTDGDKSWPYVEAVLPIYRVLRHPGAVGLFVHDKGHAVPPEAREVAFRWLDYYLKPKGE